MTTHIQGPWRTDAAGGFPNDIHDAAGELLARVVPEAGAGVAERIVACVNACEGLLTTTLSEGGLGCIATHVAVALGEYEALQAQRDELLAAAEFFMAQACGAEDDVCGDWDRHEAAIAKAKVGAV